VPGTGSRTPSTATGTCLLGSPYQVTLTRIWFDDATIQATGTTVATRRSRLTRGDLGAHDRDAVRPALARSPAVIAGRPTPRPRAAGDTAPDYVPLTWTAGAPGADRDVALDLLRGLAMVILVVNHLHLQSPVATATRAVLSAAEVLVAVSGVVAGMVFGRRWLALGAGAVTRQLLRRALKIYVAAVVVAALVAVATLVPGLATRALTVSGFGGVPRDLYAYDNPLRLALGVVVLEAGPWQLSILGFFVAVLALAPVVLWALERGRWQLVLLGSWVIFAAGRQWPIEVLPFQSERPFPLLVWQLLFVNGMVIGWHRHSLARRLRARRHVVSGAAIAMALAAVALQIGGPALLSGDAWDDWRLAHFDKQSLDPLRIVAMMSITGALYLTLRRRAALAERTVGRILLPLGRNSFYVFVVHVFVCLAVATALALRGAPTGQPGNALIQIAAVAVLVLLVRRRFLFQWIPR